MQAQAQLDLGMPIVNSFRTIHYLGSKRRLLGTIRDLVNEVTPLGGTVCDLFAGSGTVAAALSVDRPVVTADIQHYSQVLCSALLIAERPGQNERSHFQDEIATSSLHQQLREALSDLIIFEESSLKSASQGDSRPLCDVVLNGSLLAAESGSGSPVETGLSSAISSSLGRLARLGLDRGPKAVITRHFGGQYFSYSQAIALDAALEVAHNSREEVRDLFLASILSTASDIVNTVGKQFAQPILPIRRDNTIKEHLVAKIIRDRSLPVLSVIVDWASKYAAQSHSAFNHRTLQGDYRDILDGQIDDVAAIYADPPYTRDHYSRFYHVLETMVLRDTPEISTVSEGGGQRLSRGMYRQSRHQSPFCIKSQAPGAFRALFQRSRHLDVPLIVSYSSYTAGSSERPRLLTMDDLVAIARECYPNVEVRSGGHFTHSKLNTSHLNTTASNSAESLLVCVP